MGKKSRKKRKNRQRIEKNKKKEDIKFTLHVAAYIDLLKQSHLFEEVDKLIEKEASNSEIEIKLAEGIRRVKKLRDVFNSFLGSYTKHNLEKYSNLTKTERDLMQRMLKTDIKRQVFSDTIVYYSSLFENPKLIPITSIQCLFVAISGIFTFFLSDSDVFRAGIDIGLGSSNCFEREELYGPALCHAYNLESKKAQYPRIVIGERLLNYIIQESQIEGHDKEIDYRRDTAESCRKMLCKDSDGLPILDYLGESVKFQVGREGAAILKEAIPNASLFIDNEYERFLKENNEKLAKRYLMLKNYFKNRQAKFWT